MRWEMSRERARPSLDLYAPRQPWPPSSRDLARDEGLEAAREEAPWLQPESDDDVGGPAEPSQPRRSAPAPSVRLPDPPPRPPWLDAAEYAALIELRQALTSPEFFNGAGDE